MTVPEREPDLAPDEEREILEHAPDDPPQDTPGEPRPPVVSALGLWWLPVLGLLVGMAFIATDHMLRAGASLAASLWLAAALRFSFSEDRAGGLVVRSRWLDVTLLVALGALVALSALALDLRDLR